MNKHQVSNALRDDLSHEIDMAALNGMSMKELRDFRSVVHILSEMLDGFTCQPRFWSDSNKNYQNRAGELLTSLADLMSAYEQATFDVALAAKPTAPDEVEWRNWTVLGYQADVSDDPASFAVLAAEAVRSQIDAKFRAATSKGGAE